MWHQAVGVEATPLGQQLLGHAIITDTIRRCFMIQIKLMDTRVYRKSYHERVDRLMPLPRGYKTLVFATFSKEVGKLTKNIGKFAA